MIKTIGFIILFFCCDTFYSVAQKSSFNNSSRFLNNSPRQKDKVNLRNKYFFERRYADESSNPEQKRWNSYSQSQKKLMNLRSTRSANWQSCGPNNQAGRMISHAFDPFNSQIIWAGSASGGLWKTTNSGTSWQPMTDNIPSLAVGAVGVHPSNSNIILIGTGEGYILSPWFIYGVGVLKSIDGGLTWYQTGLNISDSLKFASTALVWDPSNPNNVYLSTTFGIYKSTDEGENWTLTLPGVGCGLVINKNNPSILHATLQTNGAYTNGGIYKSTDYGVSWVQETVGLPSSADMGFTSITICDSFPNVLYAGVSYPEGSASLGEMRGFFKTSNGGTTWTALSPSYDFYCYPPPYDYICQGWYNNITAVSPIDTNIVFAAGVYLYKSLDAGITWNYYDYAPSEEYTWTHPDHHSFGFDPQNNNIVYDFCDGGIYRSTNQGWSWFIKNDGLVTSQFYYVASSETNPNLVIGGTQDNGLWSNNNLSSIDSWNQFWTGDGFACNVDYGDETTWFTSELFAGRMKVTLSGDSVKSMNTGITSSNYFTTPFIMHPTNRSTFFTATDTEIYKTTDTCNSWSSIFTTQYIQFFAFDKVDNDIIYGCRDPYFSTTVMCRSTNGGTSWSLLYPPMNHVTDMETHPDSTGVLFAVRSSYNPNEQVWKSTDFGASWFNISNGFPGIPANCITINPNNTNHLYVGTDLGVYLSVDGGSTWNSFNDSLPNVMVTDMHYYDNDASLRIGTHGRGFWKSPVADPIGIKSDDNPLIENISVYPNPASTEVNIAYYLSSTTQVDIKIYNNLGQCVNRLCNNIIQQGKNNIKWNCTNSNGDKVLPGIYYVRLISNGIAKTAKVTVLR